MWKVEKELPSMFEVFHDYAVSHIHKSFVYDVVENGIRKTKYSKVLNLPVNPSKPVRNYFIWSVW